MSSNGDMEALYPFLYAEEVDLGAVLDEVRRSTATKVEEIVALRQQVAARDGERLEECARAMARRFSEGGRLFTFGNGGSSTDAAAVAHLFGECEDGRPTPALSLTVDVGVLSALANDVGFDVVFARQLAALAAGPGDMALAVSTSGGSENVLKGLEEAQRRGLLTVALAGGDGGRMSGAGLDFLFVMPSASVHRIQEAQTTVYHVLWSLVQHELGCRT